MRMIVLLSILAVSSGCTSVALKRATLAHAGSTADLRYREVVENLAMIASNAELLPAYSSIFAGTTDINDIGKATSTSLWARTAQKPFRYASFFSQQTADFMGSRSFKSNWSLDPTIAPEKLRAMRAACQWVANGPESVGPDVDLLRKFEPGNPCGYYFDVIHRLQAMPREWLHHADRRLDVPHDACYWAECGGSYVWVGPEEMGFLSELVLTLQHIARANLEMAYFPQTHTRKIEKVFDFPNAGGPYSAKATFFVDEQDVLTSAEDTPPLPRKKRFDNVGKWSDLHSVINASAKSPQ
jgi:hypothetical protein